MWAKKTEPAERWPGGRLHKVLASVFEPSGSAAAKSGFVQLPPPST